jgi:Sec-independent protein translocase protein TatA
MIERTPGVSEEHLQHLKKIFQEALNTIERQVNLLTTLASIGEMQQSIEESHGVGRLTRIATIYLPFSTVATVLAMPNSFAPGASHFWVYWVASTILTVLVILLVLFYEWVKPRVMERAWDLLGLYKKGQTERKNEGSQNKRGEEQQQSHQQQQQENQEKGSKMLPGWIRRRRKGKADVENPDTES